MAHFSPADPPVPTPPVHTTIVPFVPVPFHPVHNIPGPPLLPTEIAPSDADNVFAEVDEEGQHKSRRPRRAPYEPIPIPKPYVEDRSRWHLRTRNLNEPPVVLAMTRAEEVPQHPYKFTRHPHVYHYQRQYSTYS